MIDIDYIDNYFKENGQTYKFELNFLEKLICKCKELFPKEVLNNIFIKGLYDTKNNNIELIMYDSSKIIIAKRNSDNEDIDIDMIPKKNISKITIKNFHEPRLEIFNEYYDTIILDTEVYKGKRKFNDLCEFINEFIKSF